MPELQQPDIVGNFLSSYYTAQQKQQADADRQRNMMRQDRADSMAQQQFDWQSQDRALEAAAEATSKELRLLKPGDKAGFDAALQRLVAQGHIKPEDAGKYNYTMLPDLLMQDKQWREAKAFQTQQQVAQANINQSNAAADASRRVGRGHGGSGDIDNKTFDNISSLRKEFQGATKDFGTVRDAYGRIKATSGAATPAGDISMIYAYMKMLDPNSVVRESEFSIAQNARPLLDRMGLSWDSVKAAWQGQKLQPEVRRDFLNQASALYGQQLEQYNNTKKTYEGLSQKFGFDPSMVLTDQTGGMKADATVPPPAGGNTAPPPVSTNGYTVRKVR